MTKLRVGEKASILHTFQICGCGHLSKYPRPKRAQVFVAEITFGRVVMPVEFSQPQI